MFCSYKTILGFPKFLLEATFGQNKVKKKLNKYLEDEKSIALSALMVLLTILMLKEEG